MPPAARVLARQWLARLNKTITLKELKHKGGKRPRVELFDDRESQLVWLSQMPSERLHDIVSGTAVQPDDLNDEFKAAVTGAGAAASNMDQTSTDDPGQAESTPAQAQDGGSSSCEAPDMAGGSRASHACSGPSTSHKATDMGDGTHGAFAPQLPPLDDNDSDGDSDEGCLGGSKVLRPVPAHVCTPPWGPWLEVPPSSCSLPSSPFVEHVYGAPLLHPLCGSPPGAPRVTGCVVCVLIQSIGRNSMPRAQFCERGLEGSWWLCEILGPASQATARQAHATDLFEEGWWIVRIKWYKHVPDSSPRRYTLLQNSTRRLSVSAIIRVDGLEFEGGQRVARSGERLLADDRASLIGECQ